MKKIIKTEKRISKMDLCQKYCKKWLNYSAAMTLKFHNLAILLIVLLHLSIIFINFIEIFKQRLKRYPCMPMNLDVAKQCNGLSQFRFSWSFVLAGVEPIMVFSIQQFIEYPVGVVEKAMSLNVLRKTW